MNQVYASGIALWFSTLALVLQASCGWVFMLKYPIIDVSSKELSRGGE
jgi:hypothetical protein